MKRLFVFIFVVLSFFILSAESASDKYITGVYISGIGCPNCAHSDKIIFRKALDSQPELILIEYEIYKKRESNRDTALEYFKSYYPGERAGIPCIIFNKEIKGIGRDKSVETGTSASKSIKGGNPFPSADGNTVDFKKLDLTNLPGKIQIWHKNRILIAGKGGNNEILKQLLISDHPDEMLKRIEHEKTEAFDVEISQGHIPFENAVKIGDWTFMWRDEEQKIQKSRKEDETEKSITTTVENKSTLGIPTYISLILLVFLFAFYFIDRHNMIKKGTLSPLTEKQKNFIVVGISLIFLLSFFGIAANVSPKFLEEMGYQLPLPVFTAAIAVVDGFNPCNMFVLTFLMALIVSVSHSRLRIYVVGYSFVFMVYIIYFLFMAAWLNIFKYIGFVDPLRIGIAILALIAGLINCKELIFFKKGISLTTSDKGRGFLEKKTRKVRNVIKNGSLPILIISSLTLGFFASLIELPCTAGFPIVYTTVLSGLEIAETSFMHYFWIAAYNFFYIIPLAVIIFIFGYTFRGKAISETAVKRMKFIGGFIMLVLGIILLVNPALVGITM